MGASAILLLSEATLLAVIALVAIVVVALVVLAALVLVPRITASANATTAAAPVPVPIPAPSGVVPRLSAARPLPGGRSVEIDVPTRHVDEFVHALRASGWLVHETGEVVATDEDEEGLTTVLVDLPHAPQRTPSGEEIH